MKKTVSISIAGTLFWVEEDAYRLLEKYLSGIKSFFAGQSEADEIVSDIEGRIAERFLESRKQIITEAQASSVIASMGDVHDFGGGASEASDTNTEKPKESAQEKAGKRLFRNPEDTVIAGVCSGLAAYFGIEVVWVRLIFAGLILFNGFGILFYVVLWLSMPEAKTASQQLEMTGTPVTLKTLSEQVKDRVEKVKKDEHLLKRIAAVPFSIVKGLVSFLTQKVAPVVGKVLGVFLSIVAVILLLAVSIGFGFALVNSPSVLVDFPIETLVPIAAIKIALVAFYFVLIVPLVFLSVLGTSLVLGKRTIRANATLGLLGLWFVAIIASGVVATSFGTKVAAFMETDPSYQRTTQTISVPAFSAIEAQNGLRVTYTEAATSSVKLIGRARDIEHVVVSSADGKLTLSPARRERFCLFCDFGVALIEVSAPSIKSFHGENGVRFDSKDIVFPSFEITLSNGSRGTLTLDVKEFSGDVSNASSLTLSGKTRTMTIKAENGGYVDAGALSGVTGTVSVNNGSRVYVGKTDTLTVTARNGGYVSYEGKPTLEKDVKNGSRVESSEPEEIEMKEDF